MFCPTLIGPHHSQAHSCSPHPCLPPATRYTLENTAACCTLLLFLIYVPYISPHLTHPHGRRVSSAQSSHWSPYAQEQHSPQGAASQGLSTLPVAHPYWPCPEYPDTGPSVPNPDLSVLTTPNKAHPLASSGLQLKGYLLKAAF